MSKHRKNGRKAEKIWNSERNSRFLKLNFASERDANKRKQEIEKLLTEID